jgi:hypothetical protein
MRVKVEFGSSAEALRLLAQRAHRAALWLGSAIILLIGQPSPAKAADAAWTNAEKDRVAGICRGAIDPFRYPSRRDQAAQDGIYFEAPNVRILRGDLKGGVVDPSLRAALRASAEAEIATIGGCVEKQRDLMLKARRGPPPPPSALLYEREGRWEAFGPPLSAFQQVRLIESENGEAGRLRRSVIWDVKRARQITIADLLASRSSVRALDQTLCLLIAEHRRAMEAEGRFVLDPHCPAARRLPAELWVAQCVSRNPKISEIRFWVRDAYRSRSSNPSNQTGAVQYDIRLRVDGLLGQLRSEYRAFFGEQERPCMMP